MYIYVIFRVQLLKIYMFFYSILVGHPEPEKEYFGILYNIGMHAHSVHCYVLRRISVDAKC